MTDTSTRQRLLELWEKCPECKSGHLDWDSTYEQWRLRDVAVPRYVGICDSTAFALARDAMVRWLLTKGTVHINQGSPTPEGLPTHFVVYSAAAHYDKVGKTLSAALISAVEAVMETLKAEEQVDGR